MKDDAQTGTLLLPGTLCDSALWAGVSLPAGAWVTKTVRGGSLAEAAALALAHAPARVHLVGFSLGAILAFEVLRRAPQRVARLTLISANPHAPSSAQLEAWTEQERQVRAGGFEALVATLAPTGPQREQVLEMALRVGQNDTITPSPLAEEMRAFAPQAQLQVIPNAGHYLPLDAPQAVSDALREPAYA